MAGDMLTGGPPPTARPESPSLLSISPPQPWLPTRRVSGGCTQISASIAEELPRSSGRIMPMPSTEKNDDVRWPSAYSYSCIRENIHMLMNSNHRIIFLLVTVLYALLTPWLLWRVAGQPTAFVWTISLVACSYSIAGTICLSDTITTAILSVFFRVSCGTLLTVAATHLIGPTTGAIIFTLFTFYAAGMLGYAIGEHLQRVGFENSAGIAAARPARDEELQRRRDESVFYICFIQGNMTLGLIVRMAWLAFFPVVSGADDLLFIVEELSQEAMFLSWMGGREGRPARAPNSKGPHRILIAVKPPREPELTLHRCFAAGRRWLDIFNLDRHRYSACPCDPCVTLT
nr:unnamed protein product [Digitaria exilis]